MRYDVLRGADVWGMEIRASSYLALLFPWCLQWSVTLAAVKWMDRERDMKHSWGSGSVVHLAFSCFIAHVIIEIVLLIEII